mgnify:CR=1 FL=1
MFWCIASAVHATDASIATQWNATVLEVAEAEDRFLTLKGLRTATLLHLAMHDALNGLDGRYQPFIRHEDDTRTSSAAVAVHAAFAIAVSQYPDQTSRFESLRAQQLA